MKKDYGVVTYLKLINCNDTVYLTFLLGKARVVPLKPITIPCLELTLPQQWRYVSKKENPVDDASRGMQIKTFMQNYRWFKGPSFLWTAEDYQPPIEAETSIQEDDPEIKREHKVNSVILQMAQNPTNYFITYFSEWRKLCLKSKELLALGKDCNAITSTIDVQMNLFKATLVGQSLSLEDLFEAEMVIVCFSQQQRFQNETEQ